MRLFNWEYRYTKEAAKNSSIDLFAMAADQINRSIIADINKYFPIRVEDGEYDTSVLKASFYAMSEEEFRNSSFVAKIREIQSEIDRLEKVRAEAVKDQDFNYASSIRAMIEGLNKAKQILIK